MIKRILKQLHKEPSPSNETGLKIVPSTVELAETQTKLGNFEEAIKLWQKVINASSAPGGAFMRLAFCYEQRGDNASFEKTLRAGSEKNPKHSKLRFRLFNYLFDNRRYDDAFLVYKDMVRYFDPNLQKELYPKYARNFLTVGRQDYATQIIDDGLKKWPHLKQLVEIEPEWLMESGNFDKGLALWEQASEGIAEGVAETQAIIRYYRSVIGRLNNIDDLKKTIEKYKKNSAEKKKYVIYSAISGTYDDLKLPDYIDDRFDYVLFTDVPQPDIGFYDIREIPFVHNDPTRSARYVKTHPHTLLPEYEVAVWVDANIIISGDIVPYIEKVLNSRSTIGSVEHPSRDNVYQEAAECLKQGKDSTDDINKQVSFYRKQRFDGSGLVESGFLIYNLNNKEDVINFCTLWWNQINSYSRRDQLGYGYAVYKSKVKTFSIMERPTSPRTSANFMLVTHTHATLPNKQLMSALSNDTLIKPSTEKLKPFNSENALTTVDVIVCVHNALEETKKCLASIENTKNKQLQKLIIIDDGSFEPTKNYLREFAEKRSWVVLKRRRAASGYTKAANRGLKKSSSDFVMLVNSDTIVTNNWIEKMTLALHSYPSVGLVGPLSSAASHQSIPQHLSSKGQTAINDLPTGVTPDQMNQLVEKWSSKLDYPVVPLIHGFCFGISRNLINSIGYFDEKNFPKGYGEENDYCMRAADNGFHMVIAVDTYIYHAKSKSYTNTDRRVGLMKSGSESLRKLYSKERIDRAVRTMQTNPSLVVMREKAQELYK